MSHMLQWPGAIRHNVSKTSAPEASCDSDNWNISRSLFTLDGEQNLVTFEPQDIKSLSLQGKKELSMEIRKSNQVKNEDQK